MIKARRACAPLKESRARFRELSPNLLANSYEFIVDIFKGSESFRAHPEWVVLKRDGIN